MTFIQPKCICWLLFINFVHLITARNMEHKKKIVTLRERIPNEKSWRGHEVTIRQQYI